MLEVVGLGALNYDELYAVERIAAGGEEVGILHMHTAPGGSAANTIVALARLGVSTGFVGVVGNDQAGDFIIEEMRKEGVETRIKRKNGRTGRALSFIDRSGERALYIFAGVNDSFSISDVDFSFINTAKILHMSSFVSEEQFEMQKEIARRIQTKLSFSPGMLCFSHRFSALSEIFARCDVVFFSLREFSALFPALRRRMEEHGHKGLLEEFTAHVLDAGARTVCVTLGGEGCYIASKEASLSVPAFPTNVVDTTGAGDAFAAGFLAAKLRGKSLEECGRIGNFVASCCIREFGCRKGLPRREELERFLANGHI